MIDLTAPALRACAAILDQEADTLRVCTCPGCRGLVDHLAARSADLRTRAIKAELAAREAKAGEGTP